MQQNPDRIVQSNHAVSAKSQTVWKDWSRRAAEHRKIPGGSRPELDAAHAADKINNKSNSKTEPHSTHITDRVFTGDEELLGESPDIVAVENKPEQPASQPTVQNDKHGAQKTDSSLSVVMYNPISAT